MYSLDAQHPVQPYSPTSLEVLGQLALHVHELFRMWTLIMHHDVIHIVMYGYDWCVALCYWHGPGGLALTYLMQG